MAWNKAFMFAVVIIASFFCIPLAAQSNESLGDAARRMRAKKNKPAGQATEPVTSSGQMVQPATPQHQDDAEAWQDLVGRGDDAASSADYVAAEKLFRQSLAYAEQHNLGTDTIAASNDAIGQSLRAQRKYAEAEEFHRSALKMRRSLYPENDESVARSKAGLGIALVGLGRYLEAETLLLESLNAYHSHPQAQLCAWSMPLDGLTMLYKSNHQYSKGDRVYTEAFALMTENRGTPCENFTSMLDHLAELYADDNQWDRVEKIQQGRASLTLGMKGPHSMLYGDAISAVAETLQKRHRFEEAATAFAQAADIYRHTDPPARSKLAWSLESQEMNLQLAGKNEEAKQLHPAVLAASKEGDTDDPRGEMMSLRNRALEARKNGNAEEEERLIAQEVAASQKLGAWDQIVALTDSAMIHQEQQKFPEAEAELKRVLELSIASTGDSSSATAQAHLGLGGFYLTQHRLGEAEESYSAALALLGAHDTDPLKMAFTQLGYAYLQGGKFDRAEAVYQRSVKLAEDTHDDAGLSGALQYLAMIYQKTNRVSDAEAALTRALKVSARLPKGMNRQWAGTAMMAASFYEQSGRPKQAEELYGRLIAFLEKEVGADSPALRLPLDKLITLLKAQGRLAEVAQYESRRDKLPPMPTMPGLAH